VVDFSRPKASCTRHLVRRTRLALVVGGNRPSECAARDPTDRVVERRVVVASNFSVGAVLAERFAAAAARLERVEIIELHHDKKVDAPSERHSRRSASSLRRDETPIRLHSSIRRLAFSVEARAAPPGDGVKIHSVRLPGLVAHQEVLFGTGEGLTIRHDSSTARVSSTVVAWPWTRSIRRRASSTVSHP